MQKIFLPGAASTARTAAIGVPAWRAMHASSDGSVRSFTTLFETGGQTMPLVLASDDDQDDRRLRRGAGPQVQLT